MYKCLFVNKFLNYRNPTSSAAYTVLEEEVV